MPTIAKLSYPNDEAASQVWIFALRCPSQRIINKLSEAVVRRTQLRGCKDLYSNHSLKMEIHTAAETE